MRLRIALLLSLCIACLPVLVVASQVLTPFEAVYRVKIRGLSGEMTLALERTDAGYRARSRLDARGLAGIFFRGELLERADFDVRDDVLVPESYESVDTLTGDDTQTNIRFDQAAGLVRERAGDDVTEYPLTGKTYDRLSLQFALMLSLAAGEQPAHFVLLDGEQKSLDIRYSRGRVETGYGEFDTIRVEHQRRGSSRSTVLWCAPELGFLPVRIEQYRKGKLHVRAGLVRLQRNTPAGDPLRVPAAEGIQRQSEGGLADAT